MLKVYNYSNLPFGTKFAVGQSYTEDNKQRMYNIGYRYENAVTDNPKDIFVVNSEYIKYYKDGVKHPLTFRLSEQNGYIKELLKSSDDTIIAKFKKLSDIANVAFECEEMTDKYKAEILKITDNNMGIDFDVLSSMGEMYAEKAAKKDKILGKIVDYVVFDK